MSPPLVVEPIIAASCDNPDGAKRPVRGARIVLTSAPTTQPVSAISEDGRRDVNRPRATDDFATIRTRRKELRRERERAEAPKPRLTPEPPRRGTPRVEPVENSIRGWKNPAG